MSKFFYDMIHMTEGEKFVNYWWLWVLVGAAIAAIWFVKQADNE